MTAQLAFSDVYFTALTKLDGNIQRKVNELILKFQRDPTLPGLNLEKLSGVKDKRMRSLRVDKSYRVILSAPDGDNIYLFLWVDQHDDAYQWAATHKCDINQNTGAVQLYSTEVVNVEDESQVDGLEAIPTPFATLKDRQLLKLGVPEEHKSSVRDIKGERQLDRWQGVLPQEAYEGLYLLLAGQSYEDILREREVSEEEQFDTTNFAEALARAQSMSHFMVPENEEELEAVLNAPLEKWRVFLHRSQRRLVDGDKSGAVRVLGGAGTGKTVVAMHRAKWLASQLAGSNKKVLFTTFTKNLAIDIQNNLKAICNEQELSQIEVVNLDQWVQRFLRKFNYDYEVVFSDVRTQDCWDFALSEKPSSITLSELFFKEEWERVIQPQGVNSLDGYKRAKRIGRGTRLNRKERVEIWRVFEEYRAQLNKSRFREPDDAYRDAASLIANVDNDIKLDYAAIIVDEAQDMGSQAFKLLRSMVPEGRNDLFICGDAHQRIYGKNQVVLSHCGIQIRGRSRKLKINYRTTDEIRKWAVRLLEGRNIDDLDGGIDDNMGYKSLTHGVEPIVENFTSAGDQAGFIKALLENSTDRVCIVARTKRERDSIGKLLNGLGVATATIKANSPDSKDPDTVKLATVHRVKGLGFPVIIMASMNDGLVPLDFVIDDHADEASRRQAETEERSLAYVAMTRAIKKSYLLSYGTPSRFLAEAAGKS
jgi:mRNA-degrading endonuclease RelE of RelBE toxin-antitoxin system